MNSDEVLFEKPAHVSRRPWSWRQYGAGGKNSNEAGKHKCGTPNDRTTTNDDTNPAIVIVSTK